MVDIDADVVKFCRENLPENAEAFADSRLELVIDDAQAVLEDSPTGFDVIIMDLDDPLDGGPCYQLYTVEFYQMCKRKLNPGGVFVTQSGQAGIKRHHLVWSPVHSTLKQVFPAVHAYNQVRCTRRATSLRYGVHACTSSLLHARAHALADIAFTSRARRGSAKSGRAPLSHALASVACAAPLFSGCVLVHG